MVKNCLHNEIRISNLDYGCLIWSVEDAIAELARYDGMLQGMVKPKYIKVSIFDGM